MPPFNVAMRFAHRPYAELGIVQLEALVRNEAEGMAVNRIVLAELQNRTTARAHALRLRIERILAESDLQPAAVDRLSTHERKPAASARRDVLPETFKGKGTIDNTPADILTAWTVLEVLSPATFATPVALAKEAARLAKFDRGLPWADGPAKGPPGVRLYFQIVLGSIQMSPAIDQLLKRSATIGLSVPRRAGKPRSPS